MQCFLYKNITLDVSDQIEFKKKGIECQTCFFQEKNITGS